MATVAVHAHITIDAPPALVRSQFGDVAHHAQNAVHRGVVFEVIEEAEGRCRYHQTTRVGPLRLRQEFELERTETGPLVNRIVAGQFAGGSITFEVFSSEVPGGEVTDGGVLDGDGPRVGADVTEVRATLEAPVSGLVALVRAPLQRQVRRSLVAALAEDKADIESGGYAGPV
jgi:hypothetical protein